MKPNRLSYFATKLTRLAASFSTNAAEHATAAVGSRRSIRLAGLLSLSAITLFGSYSAPAAVRTWNGGGNGTEWSTSNGKNVRDNWSGIQFLANDDAVFAGATGLGPTIGAASLAAGSITFNNTSGAFTIGGTATLTINGGIQNDDNSLQSFSVSTITLGASQTWNAGTVAGGGLAFSGTTLNLGANQTLTIDGSNNTSISNAISGTGTSGILKTGLGTLTLSGAASYTGLTSINGGTLALGANDRLANGATVEVAGGILDTTASNLTDTVSIFNMSSGSLNGGGTITASTYGLSGGTVTGNLGTGTMNVSTGTVNLNGTSAATAVNVNSGTLSLGANDRLANSATVVVAGGILALGGNSDTVGVVSLTSGSITGTGGTLTGSSYAVQSGSISAILGGTGASLTKTTAGTVTLSGANTYTGVTTLTAGTLSVAAIGNGGVAGNLGQATNDATNLVFDGGTLRYTGATASSNRNFTINTNKVATFEVTANNLTITGASTSTNGGLTKAGAGTLTLTGNNLHTGDTIIKAGTLKLDGSGSIASTNIIVGDTGSTGAVLDATTKTGGFIVASGKTVSGVGTIQGSTTIQGILAPGNSAGILNNLGNIDLQSSSEFQMEIGGITAGTGYDQLNVSGVVTLAGLLNVTMTSGYLPNNGDLFFLIDNDGANAIAGKFSNANVDDATVVNLGGRDWLISYKADFGSNAFSTLTGNDVALMAVPEPSAALIGGVGVLLLLRRRRA